MSTATVTVDPAEDVEIIEAPPSGQFDLNGIPARVRRMKTREFLSLMRVLSAGLGPALGTIRMDFSSPETVARDMAALMVLALPNATEELALFLATIVEPVREADRKGLVAYLHDNPELEDLLEVFERVAVQEKDDLASLAGKAQAMWSRIAPMYQMQNKTG